MLEILEYFFRKIFRTESFSNTSTKSNSYSKFSNTKYFRVRDFEYLVLEISGTRIFNSDVI